jgi:Zn-dependent M28 family amino/carboxypeptidase
MLKSRIFPLSLMIGLLMSCSQKQPGGSSAETSIDLRAILPDSVVKGLTTALNSITADSLMRHIKVLASDEYEGRAPASKGEKLSVAYISGQFKQVGLAPGNPDGTYLQKVPLMGITTEATASFHCKGKTLQPKPVLDWVSVCHRFVPSAEVKSSEVVFVGYGVVAPEYGWDDYKGIDVRGKTIVMLVNDPPVTDPADPTKLDEKMFQGKAMTYYGRWTYKYEIAAEKGAAAAIIVHETEPAGYPFEVVSGSWGRENFDIRTPDKNMKRPVVESWISLNMAQQLFSAAGQDYQKLKKAAVSRDFKPVTLDCQASYQIKNSLREVESTNVLGKLEGSDPQLKNEYVIYSAHWDHLGKNLALKGDQILNGARDNATGVAAVIELARAFTRLPQPPKRSLLFLSVTCEEKGLLGARYFAQNPLFPLKQMVADINMDGMNTWGKTSDVVEVGLGQSTLDDLLIAEARQQGRVVKPDPEPEKGGYFRSDHFEFVQVGVPALDMGSGSDYVGKPASFGVEKRQEYIKNDYHKVTDEIKPDWDLSGMVEDTQLLFRVGYRVAQEATSPRWKEGAEFKKIRPNAGR